MKHRNRIEKRRVWALLPPKHHDFRLNDFRRGLFKDQKNQKNHRKTGFLPAYLGRVTDPSFYCGSKDGAILPYNPVYLDVLHQSSPVHPRIPLGALQCDNGSLCRNLLVDDPKAFQMPPTSHDGPYVDLNYLRSTTQSLKMAGIDGDSLRQIFLLHRRQFRFKVVSSETSALISTGVHSRCCIGTVSKQMKLSKIKNWIPDLSFIFKKPDNRGS